MSEASQTQTLKSHISLELWKKMVWTEQDDAALKAAVQTHGNQNWQAVAKDLNRTDTQCFHRYETVIEPSISRGHWNEHEDKALRHLVQQVGARNWRLIASYISGRSGKQCRERWTNHLDPCLNKGPWTSWEDHILRENHRRLGNRWSLLARHLKGRSENAIKNRWNSFHRKQRQHQLLPPLVPTHRIRMSQAMAPKAP